LSILVCRFKEVGERLPEGDGTGRARVEDDDELVEEEEDELGEVADAGRDAILAL
jgi:hypothetical protein